MAVSTLLWIVVAALIISVFIAAKWKINIGIPGLLFTYFIGLILLGQSTKQIASYFPSSLFLQMILIPAFFYVPSKNKTLPTVARNILYAFRKFPVIIPFAFLLIGLIMGLGGASGPAGNVVMTVMCFGVGIEMGLSPWLLAPICVWGANLGSWTPFTGNGVTFNRVTEEWLPGYGIKGTWTMMILWAILTVGFTVVLWVITKGYKIRKVDIEKPEPLNKEQKISLIMIIIYLSCLIVPSVLKSAFPKVAFFKTISGYLQMELLAVLGIFVQMLIGLGKPDDVVKNGLSWSTALMVAGICSMMNMATAYGATDYLGALLSETVTPMWMPLLLCLLGGFLSFFAGAMSTVFPLLMAIAAPYAMATGTNPLPLICATALGASATAISPLSAGGAIMMAAIPDEKVRETQFNKNLILAILGLIASALICTFIAPLIT